MMTAEMIQIFTWFWAWMFGIWIGLCIGYEIWGRKRESSGPVSIQELFLHRK